MTDDGVMGDLVMGRPGDWVNFHGSIFKQSNTG